MNAESIQNNENPLQVLVVEDSIAFAKLFIAQLKFGLTTNHEVQHVDRVSSAVEALAANAFDLIILDMHLPDADGMDTFNAVHSVASDVPIVILSSDETEELAMAAVQQGAQDYLVKGHDENHKLMWSIKFAIERKKRLHAEGELHAARKIQESLLPDRCPVVKGYDVYGAMFPAVETAGDYFDFLVPLKALGDDVTGLAVGDVSGHGLGPAMVMAQIRGCLHSFAMIEGDLAKLLSLTNKVIARDRNEHFVTLFLGYIEKDTNVLKYASAGQSAWHLTEAGAAIELDSTGTALGLLEDATWKSEMSQPLVSGDFLLLMTDGIVEATSPGDELYGNERLFDLVRRNPDKTAKEIVNELRKELREFTCDTPQQDDMTMVIIKVA